MLVTQLIVETSAYRELFDRTVFNVSDLAGHFDQLAASRHLPSFDVLIGYARVLARRYGAGHAFECARHPGLRPEEDEPDSDVDSIPRGSQWVPPVAADTVQELAVDPSEVTPAQDDDIAIDVDVDLDEEMSVLSDGSLEGPDEAEDVTLGNAILFMRNAIWWREECLATAIGDTGRILEILKVLLVGFSGLYMSLIKSLALDIHIHGKRKPLLLDISARNLLQLQVGISRPTRRHDQEKLAH